MIRCRLIGVLAGEGGDGAEQDGDIEPDRPVVDVLDVGLDALGHFLDVFGLAAQAADLGEAGDAGLDVVPREVIRDALRVFRVVLDGVGAGADQ